MFQEFSQLFNQTIGVITNQPINKNQYNKDQYHKDQHKNSLSGRSVFD